MTRSFFAALLGCIAIVLGSAPSFAQNAYITNFGDNTVSVISTATNTVVGSPIPVGSSPLGVAVTSDGSKVYVTNLRDNTVSVIDTATNTVTATILLPPVLLSPLVLCTGISEAWGVAVTPDGSKVYVGNVCSGIAGHSVSVIDTATNTVTATITIPTIFPLGIAITPDGSKVYVTTQNGGPLTVIATATDTVIATITIPPVGGIKSKAVAVTPDGSKVYVGNSRGVSVIDTATDTVVGSPIPVQIGNGEHFGLAVTPDGSKVYVSTLTGTVSVIDTATNMVVAVLPVGNGPIAFGVFIQPRFAGTRGDKNCFGVSVSALTQTFGGLNAAAIALGFPTVQGLQAAVDAFCGA